MSDRVDEIRARLAAATPGPWKAQEWHGNDDGGWAAVGPHHTAGDVEDDDDRWDADQPDSVCHNKAKADAALIAAVPDDLTYLLNEVEAMTTIIKGAPWYRDIEMLQAENAQMREFIEECASPGYRDSNMKSVLEWVRVRAAAILAGKGKT